MNKTYIYIVCILMFALLGSCGVKRTATDYDYSTKIIASELDGSYTVIAWGKARNAADAFNQAHKQAAYDIIFNGIVGNTRETSLKPLLFDPNARDKYEDYFNNFFKDGGEYTKYTSIKEKQWFSSKWVRNDQQSLCKTTVCVFRSKLKEKLIKDGIIKE